MKNKIIGLQKSYGGLHRKFDRLKESYRLLMLAAVGMAALNILNFILGVL